MRLFLGVLVAVVLLVLDGSQGVACDGAVALERGCYAAPLVERVVVERVVEPVRRLREVRVERVVKRERVVRERVRRPIVARGNVVRERSVLRY